MNSREKRTEKVFRRLFACLLIVFLSHSVTVSAEVVLPSDIPALDAVPLRLEKINIPAMRRAIADLSVSFPEQYTKGEEYLQRLDEWEKQLPHIKNALALGDESALKTAKEIVEFQQEALLSNPLLDFDRLLLIKRKPIGSARRSYGDPDNDKGLGRFLGLPQQSSWQLHTMTDVTGWENEIAALSPVSPQGELKTLYKPGKGELVSDMDLHFDADRLMFSMPDANKHWQIYEIRLDGAGFRQVSSPEQPDVHNLDSCYLPNGKIAYISTAPFQGVPCNAGITVGMSYIMNADGSHVRQVCFEQDHNFCPTVMNDGRILYLRWEYTDIPHVWARYLFTMNPDGTNQREFYGSGGYWPNAIFYARPIPDHPTKFIGIVTGHHVGRVGELILFDAAKGRNSTHGVIQRIPESGKTVEPLIQDKLTLNSWPKFLHPYPLSEKYFLAVCKPSPTDLWGIYLVDVFDNMVPIKEMEDYALLEPIPLRKTKIPPVIPDRVNLEREDALVYMENVYNGMGLEGVPDGSVKQLRLYTYHFAYRTIAGINHRVGTDGPWEPKRVIGTVPVEKDGSAFFRVPANTPLSIQPLDEQGRALQLMRSWATAMPGELVSCVGCHEKQSSAPPNRKSIASRKTPDEIALWRDSVRGFSFMREVQPVLDKHCVGCHNGNPREDRLEIPDLRRDQGKFYCYKNSDPVGEIVSGVPRDQLLVKYGGVFDPSYIELRRRVRVGGLESDLRGVNPGEFFTNTSELIQMLEKGHHGVALDADAWNRLTTWIDLNAPCHGTWHEVVGEKKLANDQKRRLDLRELYGGDVENPEEIVDEVTPVREVVTASYQPPQVIHAAYTEAFPFSAEQAKNKQTGAGKSQRQIDLGNGIQLDFVYIAAGEFIMGDSNGHPDEQPAHWVKVEKPFWMSRFEITNEQFALFDPSHDSRYEHKGSWMFNEWDLGWNLNKPKQPVVRISQKQAHEFCQWIFEKSGKAVRLPTEAQWEYACRAGTATPLSYGDLNTDFSTFGNMADYSIRDLVYDVRDQNPPDLVPRDNRFNDKHLVSANVGSFQPNSWDLHDMHGNVWEWTRTAYKSYPYDDADGRNKASEQEQVVVRGGSWYNRPQYCRSAYRLKYYPWQKVYNVGFRVVIEDDGAGTFTAQAK